MDELDISYEGYTPEPPKKTDEPYRPPRVDEGYRPPREGDFENPGGYGNQNTAGSYNSGQEPFKGSVNTYPGETSHDEAESEDENKRRKEREKRLKELRRKKEKLDRPIAIVRFFKDERTRFFLVLVLAFLSLFILISVVSHFSHGAKDQSAAMNLTLDEMAENPGVVDNATGGFGAVLSYNMICDALGLGSLVLIPYLWILILGLLDVRKCNFWGSTFRCLLLAISTSIVLGFITYNWDTEVYWGGNHGHYINKFLFDNTTWIGALLVTLFLIGTVCCVYINELRIVWEHWHEAYRRHKAQEVLRREQRREIERLEAEEAEEKRRAEEARKAEERRKADEIKRQAAALKAQNDAKEKASREKASGNNEDTSPDVTEGKDTATSIVIDSEKESLKKEADEVGFDIDTPTRVNKETKIDSSFSIKAPEIEVADTTKNDSQQVADGLYDHRSELPDYKFPEIELLEDRPSGAVIDLEEQQANKDLIEKTLLHYKIPITKITATVGPTVTLYEIVPAEGVRISQIKRLEDDIALNLKALGIRIIAPIPGKGTVGIEVPNNVPQTVSMRAVISSKKYQESKMALPMAMGATIANDIFIADLAKMPHLLVAGATGMGKSVGLNAIIASLLYKKHPSELKLVLIDPKMVEFSLYSKIEDHFLAKLPNEEDAIITDMKKVIQTLNSLCVEMDNRYELLRDANVRSLEEYNRKFSGGKLKVDNGHRYLPYIVVVVDEFADLIMTQGKEVEQPIARIAQKARAVGIHMILATQRPSTNVITGLIKANFPGRIAFRVIQMVDSRTILDQPGANQLIGNGDMLFSHNGSMERVQCAFISTSEVEALTEYIESQPSYLHAYYLPEYVPEEAEGGAIAGASMERDALFNDAARFVVTRQLGSTSSLQRQFGIGYNRAGKLMDQMEAAGIVGPVNGAKPRAILVDSVTLEAILGE